MRSLVLSLLPVFTPSTKSLILYGSVLGPTVPTWWSAKVSQLQVLALMISPR